MSELFSCVPLTSDSAHLDLIQSFTIDREADFSKRTDKVIGLEAYLKRCAWNDDLNHEVRIYLIKDNRSGDVAAYFGLKAGMVASSEEGMPPEEEKQAILDEFGAKLLPEVLPGIEISHFAVNDNYRRRAGKNGKPIRGLGEYFYPAFIYPIIEDVAGKIGVYMVYLYAAGGETLISYYKRIFDFQALEEDDLYIPLEPGYDCASAIIAGCDYLVTTDDRLLKYKSDQITILDPIDFIRQVGGSVNE